MKTEIKCPLCGDLMVTPKLSPGCLTHQHQTRCPFVWNDLTEEQMEVLRDAALGRAVRKMPVTAMLWRSETTWYLHPENGPCLPMGSGDTPEAALKAAGLTEVEN